MILVISTAGELHVSLFTTSSLPRTTVRGNPLMCMHAT